MAYEQVHRGEIFTETFLEIGEIQIQEQINEGDGGSDQKQQDIRELHADRGGFQDKDVERKQREEEAAKGLRDRKEKETREKMVAENATTVEYTRQAHAKQREKEENSKYRTQNASADTHERAKQEASVEEGKKHDQKEGKMKPVVVCETVVKVLPQKDNQERDKAKKQGVLGETKTQHAEKMNKNRKSNVLATYAEVLKGGNSAARRLQQQEQNEIIVERGFEGEKQESQEGIVQNLHMVNEPLDDKVSEGGSTVLRAVGETVKEIGESILKPAKKVIEKNQEGKEGGGVLSAIGETVAEIAERTKVIAVGDRESESKSEH